MVRLKQLFHSQAAKAVALVLAAALLLFAVGFVFSDGKKEEGGTELESRLVRILSGVEGIKSAKAMIAEEDGRAVSAVVLFEGTDSAVTRSRVLDITASLLRIERSNVRVYPART